MMEWTWLMSLDRSVLAFFNGSDSAVLDNIALVLTSPYTWIPLYILLLWAVVKKQKSAGMIWLVIGCIFFSLLLSAGMADGIMKPLVGRLRPSHDPLLMNTIDIVGDYRSTQYGFFSGHAANTMAIAIFFSLLFHKRWGATILIIWSLINCWTRLYLGLHYPSDILFGLLWGMFSGWMGFQLYNYLFLKIKSHGYKTY